MSAIAVIPARLASTRFPRKVLADLHGRPLLWHVWRRTCQASSFSAVHVATDSLEVKEAVESWGGSALLTSPECRSGTERIASLLPCLEAELIVNVQGDEPLLDPAMLDLLVDAGLQPQVELVTPVYQITEACDLSNPNIVKVARAADGRALYFSRSPIPHRRGLPLERWLEGGEYWGHVGVYGYRRLVLEGYTRLPASPLEASEKLEQLRFLEAGYTFHTIETGYRPVAVDTPEDLERVRRLLRQEEVP